jgi:hypothetical protein
MKFNLRLPTKLREEFIAAVVFVFAALAFLLRSVWALLPIIVLITIIYLLLCNLESIKELLSRVAERMEGKVNDRQSTNGANILGDNALRRRILDIHIGSNSSTGVPVGINVGDSTHIACYAQSGGGKTTVLYAILYDIVSLYAPGRVRIAIADPKRYSFTIFGKVPHLFAPIGAGVDECLTLLRRVDKELLAREKLFAQIPDDRLCENLGDYHRIAYELGLSLPPIPWLIFVVDEVQDVAANEEATAILTRLAKKGRALGIRLVLATQRPTTAGLSHEIQSQLETKFVGFMDSRQEYAVAKVPSETYEKMVKRPGRFMLRYRGEWVNVQVDRIPVTQLEGMLRKISAGRAKLEWRPIASRTNPNGAREIVGAGLTQSEKQRKVIEWMVERDGERPSADELMGAFNVSQATAYRYIQDLWSVALERREEM